jgi:hypothetical protein
MSDLTDVIKPKADQLTSDDLIAGPLTICITKISVVKTAEQPVAVSFEGDGGKPWKPCKTMSRALAHCWGPDSSQFVGRSLTLYRDPSVKWGGLEVGGIRISHMSHINGPQTIALTVTRGSKKPFTVKPLIVRAPEPVATEQPKTTGKTVKQFLDETENEFQMAETALDVRKIKESPDVQRGLAKLTNGMLTRLQTMIAVAEARFSAPASEPADLNDGIYGQAEAAE